MFYHPAENGSEADIRLPGLALKRFEPAEAESALFFAEARKLRLIKRCTGESSHLCYNHLTDYVFTEEAHILGLIIEDGRVSGVLFEAEDISQFEGSIVSKKGFGALMKDGRRFGKTREYRLFLTAQRGSSYESEFALETLSGSILVTAFEPFGGDELNPTELALSALPDSVAGFGIEKLLLPVEFGRAAEITLERIKSLSPAAVVMFGQAGGRSAITPERRGRNIMNARIPDNAGNMPQFRSLSLYGPDEILSTLPLEGIVAAIRAEGLPAEISDNAGAFVCNSLLYGVLEKVAPGVPAGFIHVPYIREQVEGVPGRENKPFMELADVIRGMEAAVRAVAMALK